MDTAMTRLLENGEPSSQARKAKLREMVTGGALALDELRYLKQLLEDVTFQTDIFSRIPLELAAIVVQHLNLHDLWACYAVSKPWHARLMADPVATVLAGIHFPALAEKSKDQAQGPDIGTQFQETLRNSLRRTEAPARSKLAKKFRWRHETLFTTDDPTVSQRALFEFPSMAIETKPLYSHGRIAWMPEGFTICVDSLVTLKRKTFSFPEGKLLGLASEMSLFGLGSQLVVATMGRTIIAWDLETGRREQAKLPVRMYKCTVEGDQIVLTGSSQVFIYKHGGALLELAISSLPQHNGPIHHQQIFMEAITHPGNDNTIFVLAGLPGNLQVIIIHEFTDRKWTTSYEHPIHGQSKPQRRFQKANSHGSYALCHSQIDDPGEIPADACHSSRKVRHGQLTICVAYFNIYHRAFSRQYFQIPAPFYCSDLSAWEGCIATSYWHHPSTIVVHQSSLQYRARKTQSEEYEVVEGPEDDDKPPEVLGADDLFLVAAHRRSFIAWGF